MNDRETMLSTFAIDAGVPEGEREAFALALGRFPPPCVRVRPDAASAALDWLGDAPTAPWHSRGRLLPQNVRPARTPYFGGGEWYVQDAGSLLADALLDVAPGERALDLCASPGGKSTAIAERLGEAGLLVANEPIAGRLDVLRFNLARHGSGRYVVTSADSEKLAERYPQAFDAVLVDAPCSGQSLVVRGKQSLSAFGADAIEMNAQRQSRILDAAVRLVRPGGRLVYATCTFARQENEDQIARLLHAFPDWAIDSEPRFAEYESELLPGCYRLFPHRHPTAGAFAARLRRNESVDTEKAGSGNASADRAAARRAKKPAKAAMTRAAEAEAREALARFATVGDMRLVARGPSVFAFPADFSDEFDDSLAGGPEVLFLKGKTWFPSYALAMRRDGSIQPRSVVDVDEEDARRYLQGETFATEANGWAVVAFRGLPLGWCKADGRQAKNHLPKPGRLGEGAAVVAEQES